MFNSNTKCEFKLSMRKIKNIANLEKHSIINSINSHISCANTNTLLEIVTNKETIHKIYNNLLSISNNNINYNFSNNKYTIDVSSFNGCYFIIDCFHMNTITMQIYKKLINEIYNVILNEKLKNNTYLNKTINTTWVFFDNVDKLEENKIHTIHSLFCQPLFNNKNTIHSIELRYFISNNKNDDFYFQKKHKKRIYVCFSNSYKNESISSAELFFKTIISLSNNERLVYIRKYIQHCFCNEKYSINIINKLHDYVVNVIIKTQISHTIKFNLLRRILMNFERFHIQVQLDTMKHLVYEDFLINIFEVYGCIY